MWLTAQSKGIMESIFIPFTTKKIKFKVKETREKLYSEYKKCYSKYC